MKLVLDTCVIYPTVMRQMLLGVAGQGGFRPVWSKRIIGEWLRAVEKLGPDAVLQAEGEAVLLARDWPEAETTYSDSLEHRLWLPDPADTHVLAAAIASSADAIVTLNKKDFPENILAEEGLELTDPDALLHRIWQDHPEQVVPVAHAVLSEARRLSGQSWELRALLKKARLPRLAKALAGASARPQ